MAKSGRPSASRDGEAHEGRSGMAPINGSERNACQICMQPEAIYEREAHGRTEQPLCHEARSPPHGGESEALTASVQRTGGAVLRKAVCTEEMG